MSIVGSEQWMYASGKEVTQQSLKFNDDESQYLSWTPAAAGNRKTWTWSAWVKRGNLGVDRGIFSVGATTANFALFFNTSDQLRVWTNGGNGSIYTNAVYRDPSAWYHIVLQSSNVSPYIKLYVNGEEITSFSYDNRATYPSTNDTEVNSVDVHRIGGWYNGGIQTFDGYMSNIHFIDGQALDPTSFGQFTNGYWEKKDYAGSYGQNGFHLTFEDDVVSEGFNAVTYKGIGTKQSISGLGFSPDLVWGKQRSGANSHEIYDTVRGAQQIIYSDLTDAEGANINGVSSFDADGYTVAGNTSINLTGNSVVAWCWDAGENNAPTGHSSVTYTGDGSGTKTIKGFGFSPDLVWFKNRDAGANHALVDSVRGTGGATVLSSDLTDAEQNYGLTVNSFDEDGVTVSTGTINFSYANNSGQKYVAWGWDAGNGSPVSNTDGSITSTVKANPATGFSVLTYSPSGSSGSVGHGLGVTPSVVIVKRRDTTGQWVSHWSAISGTNKQLYLNNTNAVDTNNISSLTSTTFTVSGWSEVATAGGSYVAYCFSEVAGYSSFGSYTGNGSSSGPTVTTGFRPGFLLIKRYDFAEDWAIFDGSRNPLNPVDKLLYANSSSSEYTLIDWVDFEANGFTLTTADGKVNQSGYNYIYMAFKGSYSDYVSDVNTDGTIDSRVKANPATGFSITSFVGNGTAGATIGHGLSSAPDIMIVKGRNTTAAQAWRVYHKDSNASPASGVLNLNTDGAFVSSSTQWNNTAPTSSVFSVGTDPAVNENTKNYIAYCFAEVAGYSSIGSYTGTGAAGNAVTGLGFKPAFLMVKRTDVANDWLIWDTTRDVDGKVDSFLYPNLSAAEAPASNVATFTNDGFTLNDGTANRNASGGTYIYMAFADTREAAFWKDVSGQGNHWTPNNLDYRDSLPDSPANNFATLSAVDRKSGGTLSEGNLGYNHNSSTYPIRSTFAANSGKWYWEVRASGNGSEQGLALAAGNLSGSYATYNFARISFFNGNKRIGSGSLTSYDTGGGATAGDVYGFAADLDNGDLTVYRNGTSLGSLHTWTPDGTYYAPHMDYSTTSSGVDIANFGQDSTFAGAKPMGAFTDDNSIGNFQYAPPAGYLALCTANLPIPTIIDGSEHFNTVLWTGDGSNPRTLSGLDFTADFIWHKSRSNASMSSHAIQDSVRGFNTNNNLYTNLTGSETDYPNRGVINSVSSTGFTFNQNASDYSTADGLNENNQPFVAWNWKAGGTAVSNTDGSITSQVSANTTAGFSIVSWTGNATTGATTGHGLSTKPSMVITKGRTYSNLWQVNLSSDVTGTAGYLNLDGTAAISTIYPNYYTSMDSSVLTFNGTTFDERYYNNRSGEDYIAYCFANSDISKAGSYVGNGSTDGPFVYTGFRPAWVMVKASSTSGESWNIVDDTRNEYNGAKSLLFANLTNAEANATNGIDLLSNGFKLRDNIGNYNSSGVTYIYLAFAENPFKYANAR